MLGRYRRGGRRARAVRRALALALLMAAAALALAQPPTPSPGIAVTAAAHDLGTGATLHAADLTTTRVTDPPDGALSDPEALQGRVLSGPVRRGEILTDVRLVGEDGPSPGPGRSAVPVRPHDPDTVALLTTGMRVSVIGVSADGTARALTDDALVLSIPPAAPAAGVDGGHSEHGRLVVLSVPDAAADSVATVAITGTIGLRFA